jgi:hypothetical protein
MADSAIQIAERDVSQSEERVVRQDLLVEQLRRSGQPTVAAERLLRIYKVNLQRQRDALERLRPIN